ncbi:MAG TPA: serine hydrolase, partial [Thermoanaerobaculia bacterium]|nr:serine hydrolase [Thermoanaerobaculia bacterium]
RLIVVLLLALFAGAQPLMEYANPAEAGFDAQKLAAARKDAEDAGSAAVVALYRGRVIAAWGAVDRNLLANSVRKSMTGALLGLAVADNKLSLDATLADLKIDDEPPLTTAEKQARLRDLLAARSGVYHPAAYSGADDDAQRPERGSAAPGSRFYYNNWDFNALESIYERAVGENVFTAFGRRIAAPLGMEDYAATSGVEILEPSQSRHPAHVFRISARDLARFGQLYLQEGRWNGKQLLPRTWVQESLKAHSDLGDGNGYGWLWWTYAAGSLGKNYPTISGGPVYLARGTGGQALFLLPALDLVIVHRADFDNGKSVRGGAIWSLVEKIAAARTGEPSAQPSLRPMNPLPLASVGRAYVPPAIVPLAASARRDFPGEYTLGGATVRIFVYADRLFANVPRMGESELLPLSENEFTLAASPGSRVVFTRDKEGKVTGAEANVDGKKLTVVPKLQPQR